MVACTIILIAIRDSFFFVQPPSPEVIRRFRATVRPDAGEMRVFYGKAQDPHLVWAKEMSHGINTQPSFFAHELVNPRPKSLFQQRKIDKKEGLYASHVRAPLGRSHNQEAGLPKGLDKYEFTFGIPTELGIICIPSYKYVELVY